MRLKEFWPDIESQGAFDVRIKTIMVGVFILAGFVIGVVFMLIVSHLGC